MKIITIISIVAITAFSCNTPSAPTQAAEPIVEKAEAIEEPVVEPTVEKISGTVVAKGKSICACSSFITLMVKNEKIITCSDELKDGCIAGGVQEITPSQGDKLTFEGYYETYTCEDGTEQVIFTAKKCTVDQVMF